MKTLNNTTVTKASLKNKLKGAVDPRYNSSDPPDKKVFDLRLATIIAFYPEEDKCMIRMRNTGNPIIADMSHAMISHGVNISYLPEGTEYVCTQTGFNAIKPHDLHICTVLPINGDFDYSGAVVMNFITMSDSVFPHNPTPGSYLIQNHDSSIEIRKDKIILNSDKIFLKDKEILDFISNFIKDEIKPFKDQIKDLTDRIEKLEIKS